MGFFLKEKTCSKNFVHVIAFHLHTVAENRQSKFAKKNLHFNFLKAVYIVFQTKPLFCVSLLSVVGSSYIFDVPLESRDKVRTMFLKAAYEVA